MDLKIFKLKKSQLTKKDTKKIYIFLTNNIKNSVFSVFGHDYFLELLKRISRLSKSEINVHIIWSKRSANKFF